MARTGRPPKPTQLHKLHGTYEPKRHARRIDSAVAVADLADPPPDLTEAQAASWQYVIDNAPAGLLKRIDRAALRLWCEAEARHHEAMIKQAQLDRDSNLPMLIKGADGALVPSPYLRIMDRSAGIMIRLASEFGFTPASRCRIRIEDGEVPPEGAAQHNPWAMLRLIPGGKPDGAA